MIPEFIFDYYWLSNFCPVKIIYKGIEYPSVEHAYLSEKSDDPEWKKFCTDPEIKARKIKKESLKIHAVDNWREIKLKVMEECLRQKFSEEPFKTQLIETGNQNLQEGNRWGDTFWGVDLDQNPNFGENHLGRLIMKIRDDMK